MSELNAAAALHLDIDTGLAESKLTTLEDRLAKLGLTGFQASVGDAGVALTQLQAQVTELKQALTTANLSNNSLARQLKEQSSEFKKQSDAAKAAGAAEKTLLSEKTRNYMRHYEMVSRGARATGSSLKSMMESVTTTRPAIEELNKYYSAIEKVQRVASSEALASSSMASRRQQEIAALTGTNSELRRMAVFYGELEQKARDSTLARNIKETTANYMRHYEEVSRGARATASHVRSIAEAMTAQRPEIEQLGRQYRALEMVDKVRVSENKAWASMGEARMRAVAGLTASNTELAKMGDFYANLERTGKASITAGLIRPFEDVSRAAGRSQSVIKSMMESLTYNHSEKSGLSAYYRSLGAEQGGGRGLDAANRGISEAELIQAERTAAAAAAVAQAKKGIVGPTNAVTKATKEATDAAGHWSKAAYQQHAFARGLAGSLGQLWMTYGTLAPLLAGAAVGGAAKAAVDLGKEFEYQLTFVKALGGESAEAVERLGNAAKSLAKNGMFAPVEIAEGMRVLAQAGLNANESLLAIPHTLDLATVGEMKMADAAVTLVGVMNAFSMSVMDIGQIGDIFAKAAAVSQVSVADMTSAMRTASVVGEQYGASIEDTATALTLLGKVNITGTAAGTSLRNMLKELYTPLDRSAKMMRMLGLESKTAEGTMRSFPDIIYDLKERLKDFDRASQVNILQELFGERGAKEAIAMLGQTRQEWDKLKDSISGSDGFMRDVASQLEETTKVSLTQAFNTLKVTMIETFESTEGAVGDLARQLKDAFGSSELRTALEMTATLIINISKAAVTLAPVLATIAAGWAAVKVAMIGAAVWTGIGTAIGGAVAALSGMAGALIATTGAMGPTVAGAVGLKGAFLALGPATSALAGPIGILAAGLTATAVWLGRVAEEASNTSLVTSTQNLAEAFKSLADRTEASNKAMVENLRLRGQSSTSAVGDAEYDLYKKEVELKELSQKIDETRAYAKSARGMALGDIGRPESVPFKIGELEVKDAERKKAEAAVREARKQLERAKFEDARYKDLRDGEALREQTEHNTAASGLASGNRSLAYDKYLADRRTEAQELQAKINDENEEYQRVIATLEATGATQDKFKATLDAHNTALKKIQDEAAKKGPKVRIDRSSLFEQKDLAKLADTDYRTAMMSVETERKLLDLKRNAQLVNEREYEKGLDEIAEKSVNLAIEREEKKQAAIRAALNDKAVDPSLKDDFQRRLDQSKADLLSLQEQAKQDRAFRSQRDDIRQEGQLAGNSDTLKDIAEKRRQAFEERQAQFRIEREMDPVIAEGLRARLDASKDYEQQERSLLEQIKIAGEATSAHTIALQEQYKALLDARDAAMDFAQAQAESEESFRRSAAYGFESVLQRISTETGNLATLMEDGLGGSLDRAADSFVELATTGKTSMRSMVSDIMNHLAKLAASEAYNQLIQFALQAGRAYFGGSSFVGPAQGSVQAAGVQSSGAVTYPIRHTGGMADSSGASRLVNPSVFNGAPRFHTGGVLPGEVPIIAKKGEGVFTPEQMKALAPVDDIKNGVGSTSVVNAPVVNVTINESGQTQRQDRGGNSDTAGKELGRQIEAAIMGVLVREKRVGGLLAD